MDADDLDLFRRSIRAAVDAGSGTSLDAALADLGWTDALADDPRAAISVLFELQGRATATSSALDLVIGDALGAEPGAVVLPAAGTWDPPGTTTDGRLAVDGLVSASSGATSDDTSRAGGVVTVVARDGDTLRLVAVPIGWLAVRPIEGVDPAACLLQVTGSTDDLPPGPVLEPAAWTTAVAAARLALAHELVGVSRTMLELAREHALERVQFGRPISSFQAIRHRLAETLVAIEMAEAVIDAAWIDRSPATAAMAKAVAGRSARTAVRHCQQTLAGIGFTTEHDLHRSIRRTLVLDTLLGTAATLTRDLGDGLIATRTLPPLLPL